MTVALGLLAAFALLTVGAAGWVRHCARVELRRGRADDARRLLPTWDGLPRADQAWLDEQARRAGLEPRPWAPR